MSNFHAAARCVARREARCLSNNAAHGHVEKRRDLLAGDGNPLPFPLLQDRRSSMSNLGRFTLCGFVMIQSTSQNNSRRMQL